MSLKPISWYQALKKSEGRLAAKAFLVEGLRSISLINAVAPDKISEILFQEKTPLPRKFNCPVRSVTEKQSKAICSSKTPANVCAVVQLPWEGIGRAFPQKPGEKILLLEEIQDAGNVGTLIRCAAAFGFNGVILSRACADPFGPKAVAASAGTLFSLWIHRSDTYLESVTRLKAQGYTLIAADVKGNPAPGILPGKKIICAFGNEGRGLSQKIIEGADLRLQIPIDSRKAESLNVAVCGGIVMYLLSRQ